MIGGDTLRRQSKRRSSIRRLGLSVAFIFLLIFLWQLNGLRRQVPEDLVFANERRQSGVSIVKANGTVVKKIDAKYSPTKFGRVYELGYFDPYVLPDQKSLAVVRFRDLRTTSGVDKPRKYELVYMDIASETEEILIESNGDDPILSPVPNPSGTEIAIIKGKAIVILDLAGRIVCSVEPSDMTVHSEPFGLSSKRSYLRWDESGAFLYLLGYPKKGSYHRPAIGALDRKNGTFEWLDVQAPLFTYMYSPNRRGIQNHPSLTALFGSVSNAVYRPIYSPDRKYYFYLVR